jgi:hypothetical protein
MGIMELMGLFELVCGCIFLLQDMGNDPDLINWVVQRKQTTENYIDEQTKEKTREQPNKR